MFRGIILSAIRAGRHQGKGLPSSLFRASPCRFMAEYAASRPPTHVTLESLTLDNLALRELPVDESGDTSQRLVRGACFSRVSTTPLKNPKTVVYSMSALGLLDLPEGELKRTEFAEFFSGNRLLSGSEPAAHCYCGHQFGYFAGQLGDGAAMYVLFLSTAVVMPSCRHWAIVMPWFKNTL